jgi:hypothetical protein
MQYIGWEGIMGYQIETSTHVSALQSLRRLTRRGDSGCCEIFSFAVSSLSLPCFATFYISFQIPPFCFVLFARVWVQFYFFAIFCLNQLLETNHSKRSRESNDAFPRSWLSNL